MSFLKRFEVWVLLALGLAATGWVLLQPKRNVGDAEPLDESTSTQPTLVIHRCTLERDHGNARLDVEARYQNASPRPLVMQPPDVRLITASEKEVPPFILPTEKPVEIPAKTAQTVRLRYWLEKAHLQEALYIEVRELRAEIKSAKPLDLLGFDNGKPSTWQGKIP